MQRFRPGFPEDLPLKEALRDLWNHRADWPPKAALLPFARDSLGISPENENNWYLAAWWGFHACRLLAWCRSNRGKEELFGLLEPADWTPLDRALEAGKGVILAASHLGPGFLPGMAVKHAGYSTLEISGAEGGKDIISTHSDENRKQSLAKALLHLRRNNVIVAAPDGRVGNRHYSVHFLHQDVRIYTGIGELARLSGAMTCWISASWTGPDRVRLHISPMEAPEGHGDEWMKQWYLAYLHQLARQIRNSPADLGFRFGLWRTGAGGLRWYTPQL